MENAPSDPQENDNQPNSDSDQPSDQTIGVESAHAVAKTLPIDASRESSHQTIEAEFIPSSGEVFAPTVTHKVNDIGGSVPITGVLNVTLEPNTLSAQGTVGWTRGTNNSPGNDEPDTEDRLDFQDYVNAFVKLITSPETETPLTIGIYGSWGMGKSFLLRKIKYQLQNDEGYKQSGVLIVEFNAWEYSATDVIWPGLVRQVMDRLESDMNWRNRPKLIFRKITRSFRNVTPIDKQNRLLFFMGFVFVSAITIGGKYILKFDLPIDTILLILVSLSVAGSFKIIVQIMKPLSGWVTTLFQEREYGKYINQMEDIRSDMKFLNKVLNKNDRILILIDDLDRCEPEKAVEMLQAIKLLLNFKHFIVVMGIDARIITRAVEKHYEGLLGPAGASGYEYLDKIVQIPFRIPKPNAQEIENFISEYLKPKQPISQVTKSALATTKKAEDDNGTAGTAFEDAEIRTFKELSKFLRPNPRHIKRMVNVYRLVRALADEKQTTEIQQYPIGTIRWVVICGQWPYTTSVMLKEFENLLESHESKLDQLPNHDDPLTYLYSSIDLRSETFRRMQKKLDHEPKLLKRLLEHLSETEQGWMSWEKLDKLQRYTINFNPAIEAELEMEDEQEKPNHTQE